MAAASAAVSFRVASQHHPLVTVYLLFRRDITNAMRHTLRTVLAAVGIVVSGLSRTTNRRRQ
jgi:hypothetical protein